MAVILNASTSSGFVQSADTSGEINLQSNGSTKLTVASTGVSGTLVQGTAVASTSGTSIDFTGIPSWAKRITVMFNEVSTSGTSLPIIQLGTSSGLETTSYVSSCGLISGTAAGVATSTVGFCINQVVATDACSGAYVFTTVQSNQWIGSISGKLATTKVVNGGGSKTLGGTLDRIRITTTNGTDTFDAGTINIQYEG